MPPETSTAEMQKSSRFSHMVKFYDTKIRMKLIWLVINLNPLSSAKEAFLYLFTWNEIRNNDIIRNVGIKGISDVFLKVEWIDGNTLRVLNCTKNILFRINAECNKVNILVDGRTVYTLNAEKTKSGIKIYFQPTLVYYCFELFNWCMYLIVLAFTGMVIGSIFYGITGKSPFELLPLYLMEPIVCLIRALAISVMGYLLLFAVGILIVLLIIEPLLKLGEKT